MGRVGGNEEVAERGKEEEVGEKGEIALQREGKGEGLEVANMHLTSRLARSLESQVIRKLDIISSVLDRFKLMRRKGHLNTKFALTNDICWQEKIIPPSPSPPLARRAISRQDSSSF